MQVEDETGKVEKAFWRTILLPGKNLNDSGNHTAG
jgi:hypothetical protein